jgi:DNA-binding NtrC family response regulator
VVLDSVERQHIERILHEVGGNRSEAARKLGIDRVTLYRKMKRYRVD